MSLLSEFFGESGDLSSSIQNYVSRPVQLELAQTISDAIEKGNNALLEAGTGTGKTLAYLVPLFMSGRKAIVSTGTKALQDQLFNKDLPLLVNLFSKSFRIALLKGRANYVCPERLDKSLKLITSGGSAELLDKLVRVREWASQTRTGDLTEYSNFQDDPVLVPMISSTRDNCLGGSCPRIDECPLYKAREKAKNADLVVVNHHLLFADLAMKEDSLAQLLPHVDTVVVDEAHQVVDVARQFFGSRFGSGQVMELVRDIRRELLLLGDDEIGLTNALDHLVIVLRSMTEELKALTETAQRLDQTGLESFNLGDWLASNGTNTVEAIDMAMGDILEILDITAVRSRGLQHCFQRTVRLIDQFAMLTEAPVADEEYLHWIQLTERGFVVHMSPLSISRELATHFRFGKTNWLFTSATLAFGNQFDHCRASLGLDDETIQQQFPSPFNYQRQVLGYIPENLPKPGSDDHTRALIQSIRPLLQGKVLFLFTSHRALKLARELIEMERDLIVLSQGQYPNSELLQRFRESGRSILLATMGFWEGIDLRGAGISCLIIDKIPFSHPEDPLSNALMKSISSAGGNGFLDQLLPQAITLLRQGFGRLIRQESDEGLFVLGDPRINSKSYGKVVLDCLPQFQWTSELALAQAHLMRVVDRYESLGS
ncbi:MAG: ATP-dependent DNA helicase [Pseudomonadales bacterium]